MKQRVSVWLALFCLLAGILSGCTSQADPSETVGITEDLPKAAAEYGLRAAVLYDSGNDDVRWQDTMDFLEQSVLLGLEAQAINAAEVLDLSAYDLVIPDSTLASSPIMEGLTPALMEFTKNGGYVLLDNRFAQVLPKEYLGISAIQKLDCCPLTLSFPELGADLAAIQEVVKDFAALYPEYYEAETLLQQDYGYGFTPSDAQVLAFLGDQAIYTYHAYGNGGVLLTNPLLPNVYSLGNYAMTHRTENETAFASTTASCNQLLYSRFAGFAAKQRYGYALNRVYGCHGSPSMAWELHYEEITAYANNAMKVFDDLCREYSQFPSYTIVRNSYWWFLRAETITYLRNQADEGYAFRMDFEESAYSSGTHIASDGQWLSLGKVENAGSYFRDYPEYDYRAYPCFADLDGDGEEELLCGSYDGKIYCYDDRSYSDRLHVSAARLLTDEQGSPLQVPGYSAPQVADLDRDGIPDVLTGANDGKIYWYRGTGNGDYVNQGILLSTDIPGQVLPSIGDINGDGILDLVIGSDQNVLVLYYGKLNDQGLKYDWTAMESYSKVCANGRLGNFLAPAVVDWNEDGAADLAVGTFEGYIALLYGDGNGQMEFEGFLDAEEKNFKGNNHLKFGTSCVPTFFDVDEDGRKDLVCGSLEYGLAYPIDSEYFPYREELQAQLDYAQENRQYLGIHHYSNAFASREREDYELRRHKEAFASYGVSTEGIGANMHTWYTSTLGDTQTFDAEYDAGLLWNSGFSAPGDPGAAPQYGAENVIALPFFLQRAGDDSLLIQNNSVLPYVDSAWSDLSAKYQMPVCVYYHCDFVYADDAGARDYLQKVSDFRSRFGYNFVREDQLMQASAAARNLEISVENRDGTLYLTPVNSETERNLYDGGVGVEVVFGETMNVDLWHTNAKVSHRVGSSLFLSLGHGVTLLKEEQYTPLRQVNLPAEITLLENGADIAFLDDGMLQVVTDLGYTTDDPYWTVAEQGDSLVFTKYGDADSLHLRKLED